MSTHTHTHTGLIHSHQRIQSYTKCLDVCLLGSPLSIGKSNNVKGPHKQKEGKHRLQSRKTAGKAEDETDSGLIKGKCGPKTEHSSSAPLGELQTTGGSHTNTPLVFWSLSGSLPPSLLI